MTLYDQYKRVQSWQNLSQARPGNIGLGAAVSFSLLQLLMELSPSASQQPVPPQVPLPPESPVLPLSSLLCSHLLEAMSCERAEGSLRNRELQLCKEPCSPSVLARGT